MPTTRRYPGYGREGDKRPPHQFRTQNPKLGGRIRAIDAADLALSTIHVHLPLVKQMAQRRRAGAKFECPLKFMYASAATRQYPITRPLPNLKPLSNHASPRHRLSTTLSLKTHTPAGQLRPPFNNPKRRNNMKYQDYLPHPPAGHSPGNSTGDIAG